MIKTVLFDLDDTLLDFHKAEEAAVKKTLTKLGINADDETAALYSAINKKQWELLEEGKVTREEILTRRFKILFEELKVSCSAISAKEAYEKLLAKGHYFMPGALELLKELYGQYAMYIVSNGTASVQDGRIESAGIAGYFEDIFISQRVGSNKPDTGFFEYCFDKIPGFTHDETIIIGDSLTSDIRGGINSGIHTCLYNPTGKNGKDGITPEYEVRNLGEIPKLLSLI